MVTARLLRPLDFSRLESGVKARLVRKGMMLECLVRISCEIAHAFVAGSYSLYEQICSEDKPHVRPSWSPGDVDAWMGCDPSRHAEMAVAFRREALKRGIWLVDLTTSNVCQQPVLLRNHNQRQHTTESSPRDGAAENPRDGAASLSLSILEKRATAWRSEPQKQKKEEKVFDSDAR